MSARGRWSGVFPNGQQEEHISHRLTLIPTLLPPLQVPPFPSTRLLCSALLTSLTSVATQGRDQVTSLTPSVMKLQIRVGEDGIIEDVKFKTFGCGSAIASSSYMTERVKGLSLEEAGKVKNTEIAKELCLPPVKRELCVGAISQTHELPSEMARALAL